MLHMPENHFGQLLTYYSVLAKFFQQYGVEKLQSNFKSLKKRSTVNDFSFLKDLIIPLKILTRVFTFSFLNVSELILAKKCKLLCLSMASVSSQKILWKWQKVQNNVDLARNVTRIKEISEMMQHILIYKIFWTNGCHHPSESGIFIRSGWS